MAAAKTPRERVGGIALGAWMRRQRLLRGLTQAEVAERVGVRQGQIAKLETGAVATVALADVARYAQGVMSSESVALRAIGYRKPGAGAVEDIEDEEALAIAESYQGYSSPEAREIIRQALRYADSVERQSVIGGRRPEKRRDGSETEN